MGSFCKATGNQVGDLTSLCLLSFAGIKYVLSKIVYVT